MKLIIDRVESRYAVCYRDDINNISAENLENLLPKNLKMDIPLSLLPSHIHEGDMLIVEQKDNITTIKVDYNYRKNKLEELNNKYEHL